MDFLELAKTLKIERSRCRKLVVILPIGSLEYHGWKLPLGTDTFIAEGLVRKCLKRNNNEENNICTAIAPPVYYGFSHEWIGKGGTVSIDPALFIEYIDEILSSMRKSVGADKIIIVNGHGGNTGLLEAITRKHQSSGGNVFLVDIWREASRHGLKFCHACSFEALLLEKVTGLKYEGIDKPCPPNDYEACVSGRLDLSVDEFINQLCKKIRSYTIL